MATPNFYQLADQLLDSFTDILGALQTQFATLSSDDQEYGSDNRYDAIVSVQQTIRQLKVLANIDQFMQSTPEIVATQFAALANGETPLQPYQVIVYTKNDQETPRMLETKFGVDAATILQFNEMTIDEFDAASEVLIPIPASVANGVLVVGDQSGENALGVDIANAATFDTDDFAILSPEDTIAQYYQNILTAEQGSIPFYESVGLPAYAGKDLPVEVVQSMLQQAIEAVLSNDPLVTSIDSITVTKQNNAVVAQSQFRVRNNVDPVSVQSA